MLFQDISFSDKNNSQRDLSQFGSKEISKRFCELNDTKRDYPASNFLDMLNRQVAQLPYNTAVNFENNSITFQELDIKSSLLANQLKNKITDSDQIIALFFDRSIEMMIGIIGIIKAGCAYLPIDTQFPMQRVAHILKDSEVKYILTCENLIEKLPLQHEKIIYDNFNFESGQVNFTTIDYIINSESLAYVIYTSASTGNPKGVMITHGNLANFIHAMQEVIPFSENEKLLMLAPISFDLSISETLLPLASGTPVFIASEREQEDPVFLNDCICRNKITMVHCTPSRLTTFLSDRDSLNWLHVIKFMLVGGEAFPDNLFRKLKEHYTGELYNLYGPTETTVWCTFKNLSSGNVNIGRPLGNTSIYIMDDNNGLIPIDEVGELCIGGKNVSLGYLNNKELTDSKFILNPFANEGLIYKTGDLAKCNLNGEIEFFGRIDHQIKIRGYRVELKEIEYNILKYPGITSTIVTVKEVINSEKYICAYLKSPETLDFFNLKSFLTEFLPEYMVPTFYFQLIDFPVTFNGKIDIKALPFATETEIIDTIHFSTIHFQLEAIWTEVLGVNIQSADDDFFDIGGHSLSAIILINKIWEDTKVKITFSDLIESPTINLLAEHISRLNESSIT
jgi:amino acid adenylation domain-containing protein